MRNQLSNLLLTTLTISFISCAKKEASKSSSSKSSSSICQSFNALGNYQGVDTDSNPYTLSIGSNCIVTSSLCTDQVLTITEIVNTAYIKLDVNGEPTNDECYPQGNYDCVYAKSDSQLSLDCGYGAQYFDVI